MREIRIHFNLLATALLGATLLLVQVAQAQFQPDKYHEFLQPYANAVAKVPNLTVGQEKPLDSAFMEATRTINGIVKNGKDHDKSSITRAVDEAITKLKEAVNAILSADQKKALESAPN